MGLAGIAPPSSYTRRRNIAPHAIDRLRQRFAERRELVPRPDGDLGNLIDEAVTCAIAAGKTETVIYEGEPNQLIDTEERLGLWAVVRDDAYRPGTEVVVTLLSPSQVRNNRMSGMWTAPEMVSPPVSTSLSEKLKNLQVTPRAELEEDVRLIHYVKGYEEVYEPVDARRLSDRLRELSESDDVDAASLTVWKSVPLKKRTVIDVAG
jgi:hypothetical protein